MKLLIDIDDYQLGHCKRHVEEHYANRLEEAIANGTPIPDNATNGDVIQALFPNASVYEHGSTYSINNEYNFNSTWWDSPYKGASK